MILLRIILFPLSIIYCIITSIRNLLYNTEIIKKTIFEVPVISVGNIDAGGSGKTPFVIFLAKYFLGKNKKVAIISRGYKRKSKGFIAVYQNGKLNSNISDTGDELSMTAHSLQNFENNNLFIAADEDRINAMKICQKEFAPDLIILEDAFQNRKIHRDLDIVMIDAESLKENSFLKHLMIPAGNMREPFRNLKRADIIIQNNKFYDLKLNNKLCRYSGNIPVIKYRFEGLYNAKKNNVNYSNEKAVAFCGIAKPDSFLFALKNLNINISGKYIFNDHYFYTQKDLDSMIKVNDSKTIFITTEKDFIKIKNEFIKDYPVYYLKIGVEFSDKKGYLIEKLNTLF